jgi:5-methylcytosine-specific restriction endonuclease McrA
MTVEHRVLRKDDPTLAGVYSNLIYVCAYCNTARHDKPLIKNGVELLNPAEASWSEHFSVGADFRLLAKEGDPEAHRTEEVYDVNEPCRLEVRRTRAERLQWCLDAIESIPEALALIHSEAEASNLRSVQRRTLARGLRNDLRHAYDELKRYAAFPEDRPERCACPKQARLDLPPGLRTQLKHRTDPNPTHTAT